MNVLSDSCPHRPPCPGCPRLGDAALAEAPRTLLSELAEAQGLKPPTWHPSSPRDFRHRARLAIRGRARSPKIGIFQEGSHRIVDIPTCLVHHPLINRVASTIKGLIKSLAVPPYSEEAHAGLLRYLQLVVERSSQKVQVTLVCNEETPRQSVPLLDAIQAELGSDLHSLFFNSQTERHNAILGPSFEHRCGPAAVSETLGPATAYFPPGAFGQSNLPLYEQLVLRIHDELGKGSDPGKLVELYAGTGAIGLGMLTAGHHVTFNELGAHSLTGLQLGLSALTDDERRRARVVPGDAAAVAPGLFGANDTVIVDPPRKGLGELLRTELKRTPPNRLAYVSCGIDSFLRDADDLIGAPDAPFALTSLSGFDLFPYTEHIETLAFFERR